MRSRSRLFLVLAFALCLSFSLTAQVSKIRASGCPGALFPGFSGQPSIATKFSVGCPISIDRMQVLVGFPVAQAIVIGQPIMCASNCVLAVNSVFLTRSSSWAVAIPNNASLIGAPLVAQCLQSSLNRTCLVLTGALDIRIMP